MTTVPTRVLVALWLCATGLALTITGVLTESGAGSEQPCPITGLVLDGGRVTTTGPVSSARRPVEPIPWRELGAPTTTEDDCG